MDERITDEDLARWEAIARQMRHPHSRPDTVERLAVEVRACRDVLVEARRLIWDEWEGVSLPNEGAELIARIDALLDVEAGR